MPRRLRLLLLTMLAALLAWLDGRLLLALLRGARRRGAGAADYVTTKLVYRAAHLAQGFAQLLLALSLNRQLHKRHHAQCQNRQDEERDDQLKQRESLCVLTSHLLLYDDLHFRQV